VLVSGSAARFAAAAVSGHKVTLRELLGLVGEQGLLLFCAILALPSETVQHVLERAAHAADRFEHRVRPRLLALTATAFDNSVNGVVLVVAVLVLMAPLPLMPFANTAPAIGIILLCIGMAERDGVVILLGYFVTVLSTVFVGTLLYFAAKSGSDPMAAWEKVVALAQAAFGTH
jgi:hypothetical protein